MKSEICAGAAMLSFGGCAVKKEERERCREEAPQSFKEQIMEAAMKKSPQEMTLHEYRQYIQEKIKKMFPFLSKLALVLEVNISDMALVQMKNNPDCEKMVLESLRDQVAVKRDAEAVQMEFTIRHSRERKQEKKRQYEFLLLRKKKLELYFEKKRIYREAYTEFLETGRRYATPCPAVEALTAGQMAGGNLFFGF